MIRSLAIAAFAVATALPAAPALAQQEAIPTAQNLPLGGAPIAPPVGATDSRPHSDEGANIVREGVNACGAPPKEDGTPDKSPHGEVYAGVGTHGYREAGGVVCVPLGDHVSATIAVDAGRYPTWRWR